MKTTSKILSVALALILALSVFMLPASAADKGVDIKARVTAEQVDTDSNGFKIYKIGVYVNSSHSLVAIQVPISFDNNAFQLLRPNYANAAVVNANMVIDKKDAELAMYDGNEYTKYDGAYADGDVNPDYGYAMFPQDGTQPALAKMADAMLGDELKAAGYMGLYWSWMVDYTDNYLLLSGGTTCEKALAGEQKIMTFYLKEKATAADGSYEIGFNEKQVDRLMGTYSTVDAVDSVVVGANQASITPAMVSYENATITIGEEETSILNPGKSQIRFQKDGTAYAGKFDVRQFAVISKADFEETFGTTVDEQKRAIAEAGFVFVKNTDAADFDIAAAKDIIETGNTNGKYTLVNDVSYITTNANLVGADNYGFSCIVKNIPDADSNATLLAFAYIKGTDGNIHYYPAAQLTDINDLYSRNFSTAFPNA